MSSPLPERGEDFCFEIEVPSHRKDFAIMLEELYEFPEKFLLEKSDYVIDADAIVPGPGKTVFLNNKDKCSIRVDTSELFDGENGGYCPFVLYVYSLVGEVSLAFRNIAANKYNLEFKDVPIHAKMYLTDGMKDIAHIDIVLVCPEGKLGEYSKILVDSLVYCPLIKILPKGSIVVRVQVEGS